MTSDPRPSEITEAEARALLHALAQDLVALAGCDPVARELRQAILDRLGRAGTVRDADGSRLATRAVALIALPMPRA